MIVEQLLKVALVGSTWVLYLLGLLSVVSLAAMVERWWFFRRHREDPEALRSGVAKALLAGDPDRARALIARSRSFEAGILREALAWWEGGADAVADAVDSELARVQRQLDRSSSMLGTLGNNAPFIGLLGTVIGVIVAFHELSAGASKTAMGNVMGGIAEALVATGVGLFVALPAVVGYNVIQKRIAEIEAATRALAKLFSAYLKTKANGSTFAAAAPAAQSIAHPAGAASPAAAARELVILAD